MSTKTDNHGEQKSDSQPNSTQEVGFVKSVKDFLIYVDGLPSIKVNELIVSESGVVALVTSLLVKEVEAWILTPGEVRPGQLFKPTNGKLSITVSDNLLGKAISPLGVVIDDKKRAAGKITGLEMEINRVALGIAARQFISEQFVTGITAVDLLVPLGRGQRELLVGDTRSGKTGFLLDLLLNQKNSDTIVVYGLIGRSMGGVKNIIKILEEKEAMKNTVIVAGFSTDPLPLIFLTPKTAMTVAEFFRAQGKHVLLILDDMGSHAKVYREISLLGNRFPGREAYPGDLFHQHAALLERAGSYSKEAGGGSITAIPVIEIDLDDFSSFVPTNLMSMTDGHLLFKSGIYSQGRRPAIDVDLSVSRVGRQTQSSLQNSIATKIKQTMAAASQLSSVAGFGGELPASTQLLLRQKALIDELLSQEAWKMITVNEQMILLTLPYSKFFLDKDVSFLTQYKGVILDSLKKDEALKKLVESASEIKNAADLVVKIDSLSAKFAEITGGGIVVEQIVDEQTWLPKI